MPEGKLDTVEVARRLGVKPQTVYAYVSRGLLGRDPASGPRRSLFDRDEVERLAARARRTDRSGALEVVVETELTLLDPAGRLLYRGHDAIELARFRDFEGVAALLWGGGPPAPWELPAQAAAALAEAAPLLGGSAEPERPLVALAALAARDADRADRRAETVRAKGATILAAIVESLPAAADPVDRSLAARLWAALDPRGARPSPAQLKALNAALVLLADHELSASGLAARVAASAWADPYRVVLAGLGALGGALHGAATQATDAMLATLAEQGDPRAVLDRHLGLEVPLPGFGHRVYRDRDPRADHLLSYLPRAARDAELARLAGELVEAAGDAGLPAPNVDFALAALCTAIGLRRGAAATIFTTARAAGLLAQAIEEYPHRLRFRPRATYVGRGAGSGPR
ncbi:MAG TPA: citrate synthase [Solirubrobacterales bacterium]|nr:citrate synthase [Solirubrobacterales bacterium]